MHKMSAAEYQKLITDQAANSRNGRYGANKRIKTEQGKFDSKGEWNRWKHLLELEKLGLIRNLRRQVRYDIEHNGESICAYVADFVYEAKDIFLHNGVQIIGWSEVVEDFKGKIITPEFNLKRKLMKAFFGVTVIIVTRVTEAPGTPSPVRRKKR